MAGSRPFRIVNINVIIPQCDGILKFHTIHQFLSRKEIFSVYHAAFPNADGGSACKQCAVPEGFRIVAQKRIKFKKLFPRLQFCPGKIKRVRRIPFYDPG